jgi:hypothetical protein
MAKDWSQFNVKTPVAYDTYPLSVPEGELSDTSRKLRAEMVSEPPGQKLKRAVWVVHGMGATGTVCDTRAIGGRPHDGGCGMARPADKCDQPAVS